MNGEEVEKLTPVSALSIGNVIIVMLLSVSDLSPPCTSWVEVTTFVGILPAAFDIVRLEHRSCLKQVS